MVQFCLMAGFLHHGTRWASMLSCRGFHARSPGGARRPTAARPPLPRRKRAAGRGGIVRRPPSRGAVREGFRTPPFPVRPGGHGGRAGPLRRRGRTAPRSGRAGARRGTAPGSSRRSGGGHAPSPGGSPLRAARACWNVSGGATLVLVPCPRLQRCVQRQAHRHKQQL